MLIWLKPELDKLKCIDLSILEDHLKNPRERRDCITRIEKLSFALHAGVAMRSNLSTGFLQTC